MENKWQFIVIWKFSLPVPSLNAHDTVRGFFPCFLKQLGNLFKEKHIKKGRQVFGICFFSHKMPEPKQVLVFSEVNGLQQAAHNRKKHWHYSNYEGSLVIRLTCFSKVAEAFLFPSSALKGLLSLFSCGLSTCFYKTAKRVIASYPNSQHHSVIFVQL